MFSPVLTDRNLGLDGDRRLPPEVLFQRQILHCSFYNDGYILSILVSGLQ